MAFSPTFMKSLYPQADVRPPVNGEIQHCCILGRPA